MLDFLVPENLVYIRKVPGVQAARVDETQRGQIAHRRMLANILAQQKKERDQVAQRAEYNEREVHHGKHTIRVSHGR